MRWLGILLLALTLAAAAHATDRAQALPKFHRDTPYAVVRSQLIRAGFAPIRITRNGYVCGGDEAPCTNERLFCAADVDYCAWLFGRRTDDALFVVETARRVRVQHGEAQFFDAYSRLRKAVPDDFDTPLVIVLPSGHTRRFDQPPSPPREPEARRKTAEAPIPLCRDVPAHTLPCWVKPPAQAAGSMGPR